MDHIQELKTATQFAPQTNVQTGKKLSLTEDVLPAHHTQESRVMEDRAENQSVPETTSLMLVEFAVHVLNSTDQFFQTESNVLKTAVRKTTSSQPVEDVNLVQ